MKKEQLFEATRPAVGPQSVAEVVGILQARCPSLLPQAVSLFTPFSQYISLDQLDMPRQTVEFIKRYEPRAAITGLFVHQWRIRLGAENFITTSATGSGKSLGSQTVRTCIRAVLETLDMKFIYQEEVAPQAEAFQEQTLEEDQDFFP